MAILVTGSTGFVGSHLVDTLLAHGRNVKVLVRKTSNVAHLKEKGVEFIVGDLRDPQSVDRAMQGVEIVFHVAAAPDWSPEREHWSTNYHGTLNMLKAAVKHKVLRFVHCSSVSVLGFSDISPLDEDCVYAPSLYSPYAITKCEAEKEVRAYYHKGLPISVVRLSQVYGPRSVGTMGLGFTRIQRGSFPLIAKGEALIQPIYVQDVVEALILAKERDEALGQVYNVAGDQVITFKDWFVVIADAFGVDPPKRNLSRNIAWALGYLLEMKCKVFGGYALLTRFRVECSTRNMTYDISKAEKELGFHPKIGIKEGVRRTVEWCQNHT